MKLDARDSAAISQCAQHLAQGELVALPTETVYGLGARADDDAAVAKVFALKARPANHPLIVHVQDAAAAAAFAADLPEAAHKLMAHCWPGPLSLIVRRREGVATAAAGGLPTIALRCPSHPVAQALICEAHALGVPGIAAPSANRFGRVSPTTAEHVVEEFGDELWVLDGGACEVGIESAIVDLTRTRPALLRPGAWPIDEWQRRSGVLIDPAPGEGAPRTSGSLEAHYAPKATLRLMESKMLQSALDVIGAEGVPKLAVYSRTVRAPGRGIAHRRMPQDSRAAAQELFAVLRELDAAGATLIWVEQPPEDPEWEGVNDRLRRAAASA